MGWEYQFVCHSKLMDREIEKYRNNLYFCDLVEDQFEVDCSESVVSFSKSLILNGTNKMEKCQ